MRVRPVFHLGLVHYFKHKTVIDTAYMKGSGIRHHLTILFVKFSWTTL